MPTYDYRCDACGQQFELFQSIKADPVKACARCGAEAARRIIGAGGGFIFKGSGFYITDYRSKDYKERAKSDGAASGGAGSTAVGAQAVPATGGTPADGAKGASGGSTGGTPKTSSGAAPAAGAGGSGGPSPSAAA